MGEPWFGTKRYGVGISPRRPAGWIATGLYALAMIAAGPIAIVFAAPNWVLWTAFALLTVGFLGLAFAKSDHQPWRWRWNGR